VNDVLRAVCCSTVCVKVLSIEPQFGFILISLYALSLSCELLPWCIVIS
jgi:hypothetical protein